MYLSCTCQGTSAAHAVAESMSKIENFFIVCPIIVVSLFRIDFSLYLWLTTQCVRRCYIFVRF